MDLSLIVLYAVAILGPVMIFLTHFIVKGRSRDMTRLWFITFFSYMIYYWLAKTYNYYNDPQDVVFAYSLLWPIAAILAFWITEKLTEKGTAVPFFKWMIYFLMGALFSFILDGMAGAFSWYTYTADKLVTPFVNPLGGISVPAIMPLLMGVLMMGVFFLVFNVHKVIRKRRIDETSSTLLLAALSIVMGGALWVVSDLILGFIRSML